MDSIINLYTTRKNAQKNIYVITRFKTFMEDLINNMDIDNFERLITKIVNDCYIIKIDSVIYKLDDECVKLLKQMITMFSENNLKHPVDDYSNNEIVRKFMIDIKENEYINHETVNTENKKQYDNNNINIKYSDNLYNDINYLYNMLSDMMNIHKMN